LALGCHIVHAHPAAEEDLKKVKLPKKYVPYDNYYILLVTTGYQLNKNIVRSFE